MSDHPRQVRIVDVFTEKALAGNQLAVVLDGRDMPSDLMQKIAREMNFSETTFILPPDDASHAARVRIFNPEFEMQFAGHPTIGTAWVMHHEGMVDSLEFTLEERVGPVPVRGVRRGDQIQFWMTFPALGYGEVFPHGELAGAIGLAQSDVVANVPAQVATTGTPFLFMALSTKRAVDAAVADPARLAPLLHEKAIALFIFTVVGKHRLYSRCLGIEIPEDAATGSASGPLGAFAVKYGLVARAPEVTIISEQGTKMGRQSFLHISLTYDDDAEIPSRVEVGGFVMPVLSGTLSNFGR
ncbi:MAG TPA: PhzF family phenazine biosynthesis protein [Candidatus Dormibacteraeota bacterium]|jgi:trans-2,3-dihydro-3-hydroxyanthranilate isomerase|nr:PhzF family phenazine biosynthesis protein [Candidatus Dormibacteraeota bacterium]